MKTVCAIVVFCAAGLAAAAASAQCTYCPGACLTCRGCEYRLVYETQYEQRQVTAYRIEHETVYEKHCQTRYQPVWETETAGAPLHGLPAGGGNGRARRALYGAPAGV